MIAATVEKHNISCLIIPEALSARLSHLQINLQQKLNSLRLPWVDSCWKHLRNYLDALQFSMVSWL